MRADADRTDAGAAAAVRNAERLVQVEMRHVGAELAGRGEADERIQVRAVDVHLAAVLVDDRAEAADARLEHAVRRRIRDHDRREVRAVRPRLRLEIGHVDVAVGVAGDDDDAHAGHLRRRRDWCRARTRE